MLSPQIRLAHAAGWHVVWDPDVKPFKYYLPRGHIEPKSLEYFGRVHIAYKDTFNHKIGYDLYQSGDRLYAATESGPFFKIDSEFEIESSLLQWVEGDCDSITDLINTIEHENLGWFVGMVKDHPAKYKAQVTDGRWVSDVYGDTPFIALEEAFIKYIEGIIYDEDIR